MLSRPTRFLLPVLLVVFLAAAFTSVAAAHSRHRLHAEIVSPANGEKVSGTIRWGVSVADRSPAKVTFAIDGKATRIVSGRGANISLNTSRLSVGRHRLSISARQGGRTSSAQVTVNVSRHGNRPKQHGDGGSTGTTTPPVESQPPTETTTTQPVESKPPIETTPPAETTPPPVEAKPPAETTPPVTTPPAEESTLPTSASKIYWGAWIGEQFTGTQAPWDMNAVNDFEKLTQKSLSLVNFSSPFAWCSSTSTPTSSCSFYPFPKPEMESIRQHGAIPVFSWASSMLPASTSQPNFQLSDVIEGKFDSYIRSWATAAKNWGHPFFLRFNWEMNGGWFQWSQGVNGNKAGEYVAAWRHVHDIFTSVGATNATWVWCPNVDPEGKLQNLASLYPGDEYVDWTGLDGYNWGTDPARPDRWRTFDQLYSSTYKLITETIAPSKPLMVGEVGSTEYGGSKAAWIKEMLETVPRNYPKIRALLWFDNYADGMDWPIESSASATQAFASGIKNSAYAGSEFSSLPFAAVTPAN